MGNIPSAPYCHYQYRNIMLDAVKTGPCQVVLMFSANKVCRAKVALDVQPNKITRCSFLKECAKDVRINL